MKTEQKRLFRSEKNKVFAGICGGIGEYTNVDPVIFRLLWVLATAFTGVVPGAVAYVVAIFIVPKNVREISGEEK